MNLMLTDFMQTVSLQDPTKAKNFLVFVNDDGEELRVPVPNEAVEAIATFAFKKKQAAPAPVVARPEPQEVPDAPDEEFEEEPSDGDDVEGATSFGGDIEEGEDPTDEDPIRPFQLPPPTDAPRSEEDVPSL